MGRSADPLVCNPMEAGKTVFFAAKNKDESASLREFDSMFNRLILD
jgi:hypothetical protein